MFSTRGSKDLAAEDRISIFFPGHETASLANNGYLPPTLCTVASIYVLLPLVLREPLFIVRKYKRTSL